tara:strand:+ start:3505 stop:6699 length:3195 start_codon:yes stop_codon:yes gene_type:complete
MANEFIIKNGFHSKGNSEITGSVKVNGGGSKEVSLGNNILNENITNYKLNTIEGLEQYAGSFPFPSPGQGVKISTNPGGRDVIHTTSTTTTKYEANQAYFQVSYNNASNSSTMKINSDYNLNTSTFNVSSSNFHITPSSILTTITNPSGLYYTSSLSILSNSISGSIVSGSSTTTLSRTFSNSKDLVTNGTSTSFNNITSNSAQLKSSTPSINEESRLDIVPGAIDLGFYNTSNSKNSKLSLNESGISLGKFNATGNNGNGNLFIGNDNLNLTYSSGSNSAALILDPDYLFLTGGGGSTFNISSSITFKDNRTTKKGIEYDDDYSANFTNRSLIDKEYVVDYVAASGSADTIYTADGVLTGDRVVDFGSNNLTFSGSKTNLIAQNSTSNNVAEYIVRFRNSADSATYGIIANDGYFDLGIGNSITNTDFSTCFQLGHSNSINSTSFYFGLVGRSNTLTGIGNYRYIVGSGNNTSGGNEQVILGVDNTVSANYTSMIGSEGTLSGQYSSAIGRAHNITNPFSVGLGAWVQSGASGASIIGHGVEADKTQKLVNSTANSLALGWNSTTPQHLIKSTGVELGGKVEMTTTTEGMLMPRLTTAQMNSILTPDTHLLIFNTTLNALYRYNGSAWVAMSAGYGVIGVVRDSDNGSPTFYSNLQSALDTCKTAGSYNTVTLYGNVTTTAGIIIDATFDYKNLTINFNGFKIENTQADATHCLSVGGLIAGTTTVILDGSLIRENGTTGKCLQYDGTATRNLQMSKMYFYNENYMTFQIGSYLEDMYDFGGSIFESGPNATLNTVRLSYSNFRNFTVIGRSSQTALFLTNNAKASGFTVLAKGTGSGITTQTGVLATSFYVESNSGSAISGGVLSNFVAKSVSGIAVSGPSSAHDFVAITGNNYAVTVSASEISNFRAENNSSTLPCLNLSNTLQCVQGYVRNLGSYHAIKVFRNQASRSFSYNRITAISEGGIAANLNSNPGFKILFSHCEFVSKWNNVGGHSVQIGGNDTVLTNCSLRVNNIGANNITSTSAITTQVANSTFDGATTSINTNVTLSNLNTTDDFGNIKIG